MDSHRSRDDRRVGGRRTRLNGGEHAGGHGGAPLALDRSVGVLLRLHLGPVWWGASWAVLSGLAAAGHLATTARPFEAIAAWLIAVPLLGAHWSGLLQARPTSNETRGLDGPNWASEPSSQTGEIGAHRLRGVSSKYHVGRNHFLRVARRELRKIDLQWLQRAFGLLAAIVIAGLINDAALSLTVVAGLLAAGAVVTGAGPVGWTRSLLEIAFPAALGWIAVGGPLPVPGAVAAQWGWSSALSNWWAANWAVPAILLGFTVVHHGATAVRSRSDLRPRYRELLMGYIFVVAALAASGSGLTAGVVALLFVAQWPFQAAFRHGRVRWHLEATQGLAMAAMLAGLLGVGRF